MPLLKYNRKKSISYKALAHTIKDFFLPKYVKRTCCGDGNCLFRAFSDQLYGTELHCSYIRLITVELMRIMRDEFENFIDEVDAPKCNYDLYLKKISKNGEWSDDREIRALSILYNMPVEIYDKLFRKQKTFHDEQLSKYGDVIRILWENNPGHFSSVEKVGDNFPITPFKEPGKLEIKGLCDAMKNRGIPNHETEAEKIHYSVLEAIKSDEFALPCYLEKINLPLSATVTTSNSNISSEYRNKSLGESYIDVPQPERTLGLNTLVDTIDVGMKS